MIYAPYTNNVPPVKLPELEIIETDVIADVPLYRPEPE
jgi:hypothetical protein